MQSTCMFERGAVQKMHASCSHAGASRAVAVDRLGVLCNLLNDRARSCAPCPAAGCVDWIARVLAQVVWK